MRTTLDIDEDVLQAARELASSRRTSIGKALSDLARKSLEPQPAHQRIRNGVPLLPERPGEALVTSEQVRQLYEDE